MKRHDLYPVKDPNGKPPVVTIVLVLIALLAASVFILSSCNVTKAKRSSRASTDSVSSRTVSVVDTGRGGSISREKSHEQAEWWRTTFQFPRDTSVVNVYPAGPATVIYEGGKHTKEVDKADSSWFKNAFSVQQAQMDSLHRELVELRKDKETRPSIWLFVGIVVAGLLVYVVVSGFLKKYTLFVRK